MVPAYGEIVPINDQMVSAFNIVHYVDIGREYLWKRYEGFVTR